MSLISINKFFSEGQITIIDHRWIRPLSGNNGQKQRLGKEN